MARKGEEHHAQNAMIQYDMVQNESIGIAHLDLETEAGHAGLVLINHRLALLGGIVGFREQHAVITSGFLVLADTARLYFITVWSVTVPSCGIGGFSSVPWAYRFGRASSEALQGREQLYLLIDRLVLVYQDCI